MASKTYRDQVIVLKKTKLKESDLILTLLAQDGRQIRAVAKGARKPTSSFAARLDLFSNARVFFAVGRNLDIVKEARLVDAHATQCVECGRPLLGKGDIPEGEHLWFTAAGGGAVCPECAAGLSAVPLDRELARWAETLIGARFAQIAAFPAQEETSLAVLRFTQGWTHEHIGRLKSLGMLISQGVY